MLSLDKAEDLVPRFQFSPYHLTWNPLLILLSLDFFYKKCLNSSFYVAFKVCQIAFQYDSSLSFQTPLSIFPHFLNPVCQSHSLELVDLDWILSLQPLGMWHWTGDLAFLDFCYLVDFFNLWLNFSFLISYVFMIGFRVVVIRLMYSFLTVYQYIVNWWLLYMKDNPKVHFFLFSSSCILYILDVIIWSFCLYLEWFLCVVFCSTFV